MYVNGHVLRCPHCRGEEFERTRVTLDSSRSTFMGIDWADENVGAFTCLGCGRMEWFRKPRVVEPDRFGKAADCGRCGMLVGAADESCPNCGEPK